MVEVLLAAGADCDVQNSNGNTALHLSAGELGRSSRQACWLSVSWLAVLASPACTGMPGSHAYATWVHAVDPTSLAHLRRCPAGKGWLDVAERLAASGADPHIKNGKGWLAIQVRGE